MQADYITQTGIPGLKIKHNNVLGYFIETTDTHAGRMLSPPLNETFIHRQTTANQVRFTTLPLSEIETRILNAGHRALEIEKRFFEDLKAGVIDAHPLISAAARRAGGSRPKCRIRRSGPQRRLVGARRRRQPRLRDRGWPPPVGGTRATAHRRVVRGQ